MPANDESLKSQQKVKKELDISKLSKVKNRKIARTFRRKEILQDAKIIIDWRKLWIYSGIITVSTLLIFGTLLFGGTCVQRPHQYTNQNISVSNRYSPTAANFDGTS